MKLFLVLCLVGSAVGAPQRDAQILRYENDNDGLGNYRFAFEQTDGTLHEQQGELKNAGREDESLSVRGRYSWVGPDGVTYTVTYLADENGFQPKMLKGGGLGTGVLYKATSGNQSLDETLLG